MVSRSRPSSGAVPGSRGTVVGLGGAPQSEPGGSLATSSPDRDAQLTGPEAVARQICLRMLTAAPRTRAQLASALRSHGISDQTAEAVLGRFAEVKLIDDAMFASAWVESRHHSRGLAGRALAAELRQRGVAPSDIEAAIDELAPERELATAHALVARKLAATRDLPLHARVRRMMAVLARKGYPQALAYRVAREALEREDLDPAAAGLGLDDPPEDDPDEDALGW